MLDPDGLPLSVLRRPDGSPVQVTLGLPDDASLHARVWKASVGRITLLMLDTDIPANTDALRSVTDRLYGGGGEHRLLQELLLGIGGARAVRAWTELTGNPAPDVFHMNEGHAGFLGLERIATYIGEGLSFAEALQLVRAGTVFTTHTPVAAGIDRFDHDLVERYLTSALLPGVDPADALALGVEPGADPATSAFNMAVMGLRLAQHANGVSKLHGDVSRHMFGNLWPGFDADEVPITSITNGVHAPTWTDPALLGVAETTLGTDDTEHADWRSPALSDAEFWNVKRRMRLQLVEDARRRLAAAWSDQHSGAPAPKWVSQVLDPDTLTVGFARRVPTYKRLTLMLQDPERLKSILTNPERPVQFVIAGKSHPADDEGKRLIQQLVQFAQQPELRERIVFLPDYDMGMAEILYPGCDVWLNNPLRPLEACGTSGMKAAMNGALNLSILDGWWAEYAGDDYGWVIPSADAAGDAGERDALEAAALYELLEHRVATRYYERDGDDVPVEWVRRVRTTLATLAPELGADRMVREYVERLYRPAAEHAALVRADGARGARELAAWSAKVRAAWPGVHVVHVESGGVEAPHVGDELHLRAYVELDGLSPDDVTVEVAYGRSRTDDTIDAARRAALEPAADGCPGRGCIGYGCPGRRCRGTPPVHGHRRARPGGRVRLHGARGAAASAAPVARRARARRGRRLGRPPDPTRSSPPLQPTHLLRLTLALANAGTSERHAVGGACSGCRVGVSSCIRGGRDEARGARFDELSERDAQRAGGSAGAAIGAYRPPVTARRSSGASSRSRPRRPPETRTVSKRIADSSSTVGSGVFCPMGLMPPTT